MMSKVAAIKRLECHGESAASRCISEIGAVKLYLRRQEGIGRHGEPNVNPLPE